MLASHSPLHGSTPFAQVAIARAYPAASNSEGPCFLHEDATTISEVRRTQPHTLTRTVKDKLTVHGLIDTYTFSIMCRSRAPASVNLTRVTFLVVV